MNMRIWMMCAIVLIGVTVSSAQESDLEAIQTEAMETYADIVLASYEDSLELAIALDEAIDVFLAEPTEEAFEAARDAWLAAQEPYGQTEAYRFYGGPIDDDDGPEGLLNAWSLDEAYIDYVEGDADAGIINNVEDYPEITADLLVSLMNKAQKRILAQAIMPSSSCSGGKI